MLPFHFDSDLMYFTFTVAFTVVAGLGALRRNVRWIPHDYQFKQFRQEELTEKQAKFFAGPDARLSAMGYYPMCTYTVTNLNSRNMVRVYLNPADPARCSVTQVEVTVNTNGRQSVGCASTTHFVTQFSDGRVLNTRNMELKSLMDQPPNKVVQDCGGGASLEDLKRKHDRKAATMGVPVTGPSSPEALFKYAQDEHHEFFNWQVQHGTYVYDAANTRYRATDKVHWRGIRNHFNPFAGGFTWSRFLPAALLGSGVPIVTMMKIVPEAVKTGMLAVVPPGVPDPLTIAAYAMSGAAVGFFFKRKTFVWELLLTYLPVRLLLGPVAGGYELSLLAGMIAHWVAQAQNRKAQILTPAT